MTRRAHPSGLGASAGSVCAAGTLRRAARSIARVYDNRLASVGLTTTQYSILRRLQDAKTPVPLAALANELVFERTSLYRALGPLRRRRLVTFGAGTGRAKTVALTALGAKRAAAAAPHWQRAQDDFLEEFGRHSWASLAGQLMAVVEITRTLTVGESSKAQ